MSMIAFFYAETVDYELGLGGQREGRKRDDFVVDLTRFEAIGVILVYFETLILQR